LDLYTAIIDRRKSADEENNREAIEMTKITKTISKYLAAAMIFVLLAASCALAAPQGMNMGQPGAGGQRMEQPVGGQPDGARQIRNGQPGRDQAGMQPGRDMRQAAPAPARNDQPRPEQRGGRGGDNDTLKSAGLVAIGAIIGSILTNSAAGR
jgi:hypothetical protein